MGKTGIQHSHKEVLLIWLETHFADAYHIFSETISLPFEKNSSREVMMVLLREERVPSPNFEKDSLMNTPDLVIQLDTQEELSHISYPLEYYFSQTQDLMDIGVQKVLWILSHTEKLIIAESGKRWAIADWAEDVEVLHDVHLNLRKLLRD